jgi:hypothetical protein
MNETELPMRASLTGALVCIAMLLAVGCAQSPSPTLESGVTAPTSAQLGPAASYDASGSWHFHIHLVSKDGLDNTEELDLTVTQDADGNLHVPVGDTEFTLLRKGSGPKLTYVMSLFSSHPSCDTDVSGPAKIDIASNTLEAKLSGIEEGCIKVDYEITATKNVP